MQLQDILYSQGFGTRRVCAGLVQQGRVAVCAPPCAGVYLRCLDAAAVFHPAGLWLRVQGCEWPYQEKAYVLLHKPAGTECSRKPGAHPGVHTLLPDPLRQRPVKGAQAGVQAVGRLDQDSTGLLLLSDDGQFIHRMSSPKWHVPKCYRVTTRHALDQTQVSRLLDGVLLDDDPRPVRAAACTLLGRQCLELVLTEGKYHQVKRMLAAVGNRVEGLHRVRIGALELPPDLPPGGWKWLGAEDLRLLYGDSGAGHGPAQG